MWLEEQGKQTCLAVSPPAGEIYSLSLTALNMTTGAQAPHTSTCSISFFHVDNERICICWQCRQRPICGRIETLISIISWMFMKCIFLSTFQCFLLIWIANCHEFWILNCKVSTEKTLVGKVHGNGPNLNSPVTLQHLFIGPSSYFISHSQPPGSWIMS